jgi:hypothetical protein
MSPISGENYARDFTVLGNLSALHICEAIRRFVIINLYPERE